MSVRTDVVTATGSLAMLNNASSFNHAVSAAAASVPTLHIIQ